MFLSITSTNMYLAYLHSARPCLSAGYLFLDDQQYMVLPLKRNQTHTVSQFSCSVLSDSLRPRELQHARPPCPSPTPGVYSNSCPLSQWCHPIILSLVVPFSSCLQSFPASESFQMSQFFASGGQSIVVSASTSVLPMNIQDWFTLGWTGWISLQSKGLSTVSPIIFQQEASVSFLSFSIRGQTDWKPQYENWLEN